MPTKTIPLFGNPNQRNINADDFLTYDQDFSGAMFDIIPNAITGKTTVYVNKRPGLKDPSITICPGACRTLVDQYGFDTLSGPCGCFVNSTSLDFFVSTTQIGTTASTLFLSVDISKAIVNNEEHYLIAISGTATDSGGYFVNETGMSGGTTFTADTNTNTTLSNVSSFTGLVVGQRITGTNIPSNTRISVLNPGGSTITMTQAATGSTAGITVTRERMAKIIDSDFPSDIIGPFVELNGYVFISQTTTQKIFQSDINSITSWTATAFISASNASGYLLGLSRFRDNIVAHTIDSIQFFYNAGNAAGSVLSPVQNSTKRLGHSIPNSGVYTARKTPPFCTIDDYLFVLAGNITMFTVGGGQEVISNQAIEKVVSNRDKDNIIMSPMKIQGRYYLFVMDNSNGWSFMYDLTAKTWTSNGFPFCPAFTSHIGYVGDRNNTGKLYYYPWVGVSQDPVYLDGASSYSLVIRTSPLDFGTDEHKFVTHIWLDADTQTSGTATLEKSDDDYVSWQTLGTFDMTKPEKLITRCGAHPGARAYRLTHSANTPFRARALRIRYHVHDAV